MGNHPAIADPARFGSARTNLGEFAKTGSTESLKRGLGHYAKRGLGGSANGTARLSRTSAIAGLFVDVLDALRNGGPLPEGVQLDAAALAGKSQDEIAEAVINAVASVNGSQDAEVSSDSASRAFAEVLEQDPTADLSSLSAEQIELFFERFTANDLVARIQLDVGNAVLAKAPDAATAVQRLEQMQEFVREEFARAVREAKAAGRDLTTQSGRDMANAAIKATLEVFEGWVK